MGCIGGGNRILACCKVSSTCFGEALNSILNFCGDEIYWVFGF